MYTGIFYWNNLVYICIFSYHLQEDSMWTVCLLTVYTQLSFGSYSRKGFVLMFPMMFSSVDWIISLYHVRYFDLWRQKPQVLLMRILIRAVLHYLYQFQGVVVWHHLLINSDGAEPIVYGINYTGLLLLGQLKMCPVKTPLCSIPLFCCLCRSSGHQREGVESGGVGGEAVPAAGFPLHVHLLPRHPQFSFPARWR